MRRQLRADIAAVVAKLREEQHEAERRENENMRYLLSRVKPKTMAAGSGK